MKSVMIKLKVSVAALLVLAGAWAWAGAKIMFPGETVGQLTFLTAEDIQLASPKYNSLNALSLPVFEELPLWLTTIAGSITLKEQNEASHIQLKARARGTPNLDISKLEGGMQNPLFKDFKDGDWVRMSLGKDGSIKMEASTQSEAQKQYEARLKQKEIIKPPADLTTTTIFRTEDLRSEHYLIVGSKAANYGELAQAINTPERTIVRPGFGIPFYYYEQFINAPENKAIKAAIDDVLKDRLMVKVAKAEYRLEKLAKVQALIKSESNWIDPKLVDELIAKFDSITYVGTNIPRKMKLRSSTNSEDLPFFNGAGLYDSYAYKPSKDGEVKKYGKKVASIKEALRGTWASVWNLRAFDERTYFNIDHGSVKMAIQVNPSFADEIADGVVITKNILNDPRYPGRAVYIEVQRGDTFSVTNPLPGSRPEKILVMVDPANTLNKAAYKINLIQKSNIADDAITILPQDNPNPVMLDEEILDLAYQTLKAEAHFKPILGQDTDNFALDLEFKVDSEDTGKRQVYIKQARPYID